MNIGDDEMDLLRRAHAMGAISDDEMIASIRRYLADRYLLVATDAEPKAD